MTSTRIPLFALVLGDAMLMAAGVSGEIPKTEVFWLIWLLFFVYIACCGLAIWWLGRRGAL